MESSPRTDTGGTCSFTSAIKNVKHVFVFFQQYRKKILTLKTPTFLTHLISMLITRQN